MQVELQWVETLEYLRPNPQIETFLHLQQECPFPASLPVVFHDKKLAPIHMVIDEKWLDEKKERTYTKDESLKNVSCSFSIFLLPIT